MIDLYAAGTSNGMRARIALEECGLPYNFHPINLDKGENKTPQFLAMNPVGQIPVIVDSEGPGGKPVTISQSSAILLYCAEKAGKHLPKARRPAGVPRGADARLDRHHADPRRDLQRVEGRPEAHAPTVGRFKDFWKRYLKVWDDVLGKRKYAAGGDFTIADLSLYAGYVRMSKAFPSWSRATRTWRAGRRKSAPGRRIQRALKF